ncbi:MAG: RNA polymerase sigma factor [Baekduia sp.]
MAALPPFAEVLDLHAAVVLRVCAAHAGADLADEVFQETMISALRAYDEVREPAAIRGWLCTIATRKAIDARRAAALRPLPVDPAALPEGVASDEPGDEDVWPLVGGLPDRQRAAVTLRYLGDLSHAEIGATLGISTDAARRNVFEGLQSLRRTPAIREELSSR